MRRFFLPILIGGMAILMLLTGCNSSSCEKEQVDRTVENVKVVYYADFDEYSKTSNSTLTVGDAEALQDLFDLIVSCRDNAKSTTKPIGFPRYYITFEECEEEHSFTIDVESVYATDYLGNGNYITPESSDLFSSFSNLFSVE